jgi:50S ribosome-binding GTPase
MDQTQTIIGQLADDLSWLEEHSRQLPNQAAQAGELRLAAALVRNSIGPFLEGQPPEPLHVVVVGGAGAGKSTVANLLAGTTQAEANPQAGFTRHPVAYAVAGNGALPWPVSPGFLGSLKRLAEPGPSSVDADVFQIRPVAVDGEFSLLRRFIVWDCPDMTTWAATGYVPRLLEVAGLADVIVYVASDERYNDEVPTQFLRLLLETGKSVIVCLVKMKEADTQALLEHFQREVVSRLPPGIVACVPIPLLTPEQLADPVHLASRFRVPLLNQVAVLGEPPTAARLRAVRWATNYLSREQNRLLGVARQDLAALEEWRTIVQAGEAEFDGRYRREYLTSEKYRHFDEALVRLLDLLELPGAGRVISNTLWVLRTPYRLVRGLVVKALARPQTASLPEQPVLEQALTGWLNLLRKESARRAKDHPVWAHINAGFADGLAEQAREQFQQGLRRFRSGMADEVERTARAIYEELEKNPTVLNTLRGGKLTFDLAAIAGAVATGGAHWPLDFILVPVAASITHQLVELLGKQYVDGEREQARCRQQALVHQDISGPLAEWLTQWPATGGSAYERLHLALRRIPLAIQRLDTAVAQASTTFVNDARSPA